MTFVLPYISDLQPNIQDTFNREVELLLHEKNENSKPLPGWLLSSGTLRILALLSMFKTQPAWLCDSCPKEEIA